MALVTFQDLPNTTTPINANNLNNNFNELNSGINALTTKSVTQTTFTLPSGNLSAGSWQTISSSESITLDKGIYLFLFKAWITSSATGFGTISVLWDGNDIGRCSIPHGLDYITSTILPIIVTISSSGTHTAQLRAFCSQEFRPTSIVADYIKLN